MFATKTGARPLRLVIQMVNNVYAIYNPERACAPSVLLYNIIADNWKLVRIRIFSSQAKAPDLFPKLATKSR